MTIMFRPAVRESVGLIIGMIGPSGGGKTYSAMRLASGLTICKNRQSISDRPARSLSTAPSAWCQGLRKAEEWINRFTCEPLFSGAWGNLIGDNYV